MDYRKLGRTGVKVSPLCLGCMMFGDRTSPEDSYAIIDRALDAGINFLDTANVYGRGRSEEVTGEALKRNGKRDAVVLATKVHAAMDDHDPNMQGNTRRHIIQQCDASLKRLQTDYIDLFQMHHVWREAPWEEIWQALELLVQQGKVLYVGSSNFAGWHIARGCETAAARHILGLVSEQGLYHLLERTAELEVLPACRGYGLAFLPWSPLAGGLLAGPGPGSRRKADRLVKRRETEGERLGSWEAFCADLGEAPADVALAWLLAQPDVTAPIIGPRTLAQLEGALHALEIDLSAEQLAKLDEIFPGPGGAAPEAYAW